MKYIQNDPTVIKSFFTGIATGLIGFVVAIAGPLATTQALSMETSRDCDDNAVIRCGAETTTELHSKYNDSQSAQAIYSHFGISDADIAQLTNTAVAGKVTKGGRVLVDGKEVATGANTAGRQNMAGSTQATSGGTTFYTRPPSASFQQPSLPAFVVMKDGQFDYAIIASCGNPVSATPKPQPTPQPQPEQPKPQPTPPPAPTPTPPAAPAAASASSSASSSSAATATVTVQQPPAPAPAPAPQPQVVTQTQFVPVATQPTSLPKTGLANIVAITILSSIAGMTVHQLYSRHKARQQLL